MRFFLFTLLSLSLLSCTNDDDTSVDCSAVSCAASGINLELISDSDKTNLFENETLSKENLTVTNTLTNEEVAFQFTPEFILILPTGSYTETFTEVSYQIAHEDVILFNLSFDAKRELNVNECCPSDSVANISFGDTTTETLDEEPNGYKVFLDL
ncbi:hypothetical protein [Leeuwenhoekiella marinoflava]|uniref:Lipoprotein n=2 Tax=Leeuwenhoekiella marinoflava TaxID=988 RepID=A0A4Q0PEW0_9FLAO|nr:hypothetical protein [Leeuwenhoekiella marinoflava]RXG25036.1 hypothetical protein DSL99_3625 [Leeuwenhoekiella marinoflava]SHF90886.1 hypothetical protein SAMN02745246_03704 [Leeuwenhoekiella marinoflava DSM 3653]